MHRSKWVEFLSGPGYELRIGPGGGMEITIEGEFYRIESSFSFPGSTIGTNYLSAEKCGDDADWKAAVRRISPTKVEITAAGRCYHLTRTVSSEGNLFSVTDTLTNHAGEDVGVAVRNQIAAPGSCRRILLGGASEPLENRNLMAENPTVLMSKSKSQVGLLAEDTISRLQFQAHAADNQAEFSLGHMAIRPGESRILRWAIYPMHSTDYFDFVNQVRRDWRTNFAVSGPWDFFDVLSHRALLQDPQKLKAYLNRKKLKLVSLTPWLDYDNFNPLTGKPINRDEYKELMTQAVAAFKTVDPDIKCAGCMEGNLVAPSAEIQKLLYEALPADQRKQGIRRFSDRQMELIKGIDLDWHDCLLTAPDGRYTYELYFRGKEPMPMLALAVYAAPGNGQSRYWLNQAHFLLEEVELDGIYIDQFSLAFGSTPDFTDPTTTTQRYSYEQWDGVTVDLDPTTGKIIHRYTDGAFVGVGARKTLMEYVLSQDGIMVANTHCAAGELQSYPVVRFMEAEWVFDPLRIGRGEEPPLHQHMCKGHLDSPVALGFRPERLGDEGRRNYAEVIMKSVITYLRHGLLYYHYVTEIPETGPEGGEYGPINHMFPLTPKELHKGWIRGKVRIITCVSLDTFWEKDDEPAVHLFDLAGREIDFQNRCQLKRQEGKWRITLCLEDWQEIAVIEAKKN